MPDSELATTVGRRLTPSLRKAEVAFGLRLAITLLLTLSGIAAAQFFLVGPQMVERALQREAENYEAAAAGFAEIYDNHYHEGWRSDFMPVPIREVLNHMSHRPDVRVVRVITADGRVAHAAASHDLGTTYVAEDGTRQPIEGLAFGDRVTDERLTLIEEVAPSGRPRVSDERLAHLGDRTYHIPAPMGEFSFVLEVITDDRLIRGEQQNLNRLILTMLAVGVLLGLPMFYLVGGRRLNRRHATAVHHSSRDGLTGLGNHRAFQEHVRREAEIAARHDHPLSLVLVDLDHFKLVNDTLGHKVGDELLTEVGQMLASGRPEDLAFRIGGDEFALVLPFTDLRGARSVAERMREQVERANRGVTLSIGLSDVAAARADCDTLRERADAALYEAKRAGRNRVVVFDDVEDEQAVNASVNGSAVHRLLAEGRMGVAFQPIWDIDAQSLLGYEALARPPAESGLSSPLDMFDAADRVGRIAEIDELCRQAILQQADALPEGSMLFINVAPSTLGLELTGAERLARIVREAGLTPERVVIELTERTIARQAVISREVSHLRSVGFKVAIDDVGAGNSGLELLRCVPVDFIKIDRSVVTAALSDLAAEAVLAAVVAFANITGTYVIAEGIEEGEQLSFLRDLPDRGDGRLQQIRGAQGYLLGRPGQLSDELSSMEVLL